MTFFDLGIFVLLSLALLGVAYAIRLGNKALTYRRTPKAQQERLELALSDLDERHTELKACFKRLQSRVGMREARAARIAGSDDQHLRAGGDPQQDELDLPKAGNEMERAALKRLLANKMIT